MADHGTPETLTYTAIGVHQQRLESAILKIIMLGRDRCGVGFGKYPLGVRDAVQELIHLLPPSAIVTESLRVFDERLKG